MNLSEARSPDEMYDALMVAGYMRQFELEPHWPALLEALGQRALKRGEAWYALERSEDQPLEIMASRLEVLGPVTERQLDVPDAPALLLAPSEKRRHLLDAAGRWALLNAGRREDEEAVAHLLLKRYGVVFRALLARRSLRQPLRPHLRTPSAREAAVLAGRRAPPPPSPFISRSRH